MQEIIASAKEVKGGWRRNNQPPWMVDNCVEQFSRSEQLVLEIHVIHPLKDERLPAEIR